eukprot:Em0007g837a
MAAMRTVLQLRLFIALLCAASCCYGLPWVDSEDDMLDVMKSEGHFVEVEGNNGDMYARMDSEDDTIEAMEESHFVEVEGNNGDMYAGMDSEDDTIEAMEERVNMDRLEDSNDYEVAYAKTKPCSATATVTGKSKDKKRPCDASHIGASATATLQVPDKHNHNSCTAVKNAAINNLRNRLPATETGCIIQANQPCRGC